MSEQDIITNSMLEVVRDLIFKAKVETMFIDVGEAEITVPDDLYDWQVRVIDELLKGRKYFIGYYFSHDEGLVLQFEKVERK